MKAFITQHGSEYFKLLQQLRYPLLEARQKRELHILSDLSRARIYGIDLDVMFSPRDSAMGAVFKKYSHQSLYGEALQDLEQLEYVKVREA